MYVACLAFLYNAASALAAIWRSVASHIRRTLGPEPQNYWLLHDGRILPEYVNLPPAVESTAFFYDTSTARITLANDRAPQGRFRPLTTISIQIQDEIVGSTDISDWLGEIRANPVPPLPPHQLIYLWSAVHGQYIPPFSRGTSIVVTTSSGDEEMLRFD
jgi:hypothetical protein